MLHVPSKIAGEMSQTDDTAQTTFFPTDINMYLNDSPECIESEGSLASTNRIGEN